MPESTEERTVTEAVGLFHNPEELQAAADALMTHGFNYFDLSVLASEKTVQERLGHYVKSVRELEDAPDAPTTAFVPKETEGDAAGGIIGLFMYIPAVVGTAAVVASGGTLAAAIAATVIGGGVGGGIGGIISRWMEHRLAQQIEEHLEKGGLLLWVRTWDKNHEETATRILKENGAEDVHIHKLPRLGEGGAAGHGA